MPRSHPAYSPEFRRQMVDPVRAGWFPDDLAREFEPSSHSVRARLALADKQEGRRRRLLLAWRNRTSPRNGENGT